MRVNNSFKGKVKSYLVSKLNAYEYKHGWMRIPICPYCHKEEKMGVNLSSWRCNCFRCGEHPSPSQLIMDVEGIETYHELNKILNKGEYSDTPFYEEKIQLSEAKPLYLPEGYKLINFGTSQLAKTMRNYIQKRGFDIDEMSRQGIGYCNTGQYFGYIVVPYYYGGELRYYNARKVIGNGPRYNNPNKDITGLGKEFIIFNHDALSMYKQVYICEGAFNALTMGVRGIATMGKAISRYQVNEILKSQVQHIIILLDPDAKDKAIDLALKLVMYKKVKVIFLPEGKDVNDIGKKETLKLIYKTHYQSYSELIKIRNTLVQGLHI